MGTVSPTADPTMTAGKSGTPLVREGTVDERERRLLDRSLRELGMDPADFRVEITALALDSKGSLLPKGLLQGRKVVTITRISSGDSFRQEQYVDGAWAGEVIQALIFGHLGPKA
jgi:hypothetical protein